MSDYLHHLITRTLSPEAGVRPQLRSAFEPLPFQVEVAPSADFASETSFESNPVYLQPVPSQPLTAPAALERVPDLDYTHVPPAASLKQEEPRQATPREMTYTRRSDSQPQAQNESKEMVQPPQPALRKASKEPMILRKAISALPESDLDNSHAISVRAATPRAGPDTPQRTADAAPQHNLLHPTPATVPQQTVEFEGPRFQQVTSVETRSVAPAATVLSPRLPVAPSPDLLDPPVEALGNRRLDFHKGPVHKLEVAAIRPVAAEARVFSPRLLPPVAPPPPAPTIHVTIGRVEIRAGPPPPKVSRAGPTLPSVMSLEEYLGRRAAGGRR